MKYLFAAAFVFLVGQASSQTVKPLAYWTFDSQDPIADITGGKKMDLNSYKCQYSIVKGVSGKGIDLSACTGLAIPGVLPGNIQSALSIEFLAKGSRFRYECFPNPQLFIVFEYPYIQFITTTSTGGTVEKDNWIIKLDGGGKRSYDYYADGNWHHWVFTLDARAGVKKVYADGECPEGFSKDIKKGVSIVMEGGDAFSYTSMLDEVAFYNSILPEGLIAQHADEARSGSHYSYTAMAGKTAVAPRPMNKTGGYDPQDFAPGYPVYTSQATDQLKQFPLPRFARNNPTHPNFPWLDITYLHRELPEPGAKGFGTVNPAKAVELTEEMARNWHYSMELPCLRTDSGNAASAYGNPGTVPGALIRFANGHPQYPTATILMEAQINPSHAGYSRQDCFMNAQDLAGNYYLKDGSGKPVIYNGKKWLSPLMPLDIIQKDARVSTFYLRQLLKHLDRPMDYINENGELFGHMRPRELLEMDPAVKRQILASGLNNAQYNGWFQGRIDSCYKTEVIRGSGAAGAFFTFYNISATNPEYWPDYAVRRNTNTRIGNDHYSTPSFYPVTPSNWIDNQGAWNGYGTVARGRRTEIMLGDRLFAPFVSAGWDLEENNIRPAQWLALLKSMMMLGADFFHVGYFNVTGSSGWPDGKGPNDPRGYIYQVAMPAYTQAIASRCWDFLRSGVLLNPADTADKIGQFRFRGKKENELILVRKLDHRYLIYGSIQPNSNVKGNVPDKVTAEIELENETIRFEIRRQGSIYLLDKTNAQAPVFFQLDGWHEASHPWYWSKQFLLEAEMPDNYSYAEIPVATELSADRKNDLSQFVTYIRLQNVSKKFEFDLGPRQKSNFYCYILARANSDKSSLATGLKGTNVISSCSISGRQWKWYLVKWPQSDAIELAPGPHTLVIQLQSGAVDIDKIMISPYKVNE